MLNFIAVHYLAIIFFAILVAVFSVSWLGAKHDMKNAPEDWDGP